MIERSLVNVFVFRAGLIGVCFASNVPLMFFLILPAQPRQAEDATDFFAIERLRQHIVGSEIQGFRPQMFIRKTGSED